MQVIEQIHQEFDVAQQCLLDQATELLENKPKEVNKELIERIEQMGFTNSHTVQEIKKEGEARKSAKKVAGKVNYYFKHYPFNKFITKTQVKDICKKYGLVFGEIGWFTGVIPEKNMLEIADFEVKEKDKDGGMMIVGDESQFDLKNNRLQLDDEWELKRLPDPDPIVLQKVRGGFLIISKWGKEAEIEEVQ